jgi:hypothetical protein
MARPSEQPREAAFDAVVGDVVAVLTGVGDACGHPLAQGKGEAGIKECAVFRERYAGDAKADARCGEGERSTECYIVKGVQPGGGTSCEMFSGRRRVHQRWAAGSEVATLIPTTLAHDPRLLCSRAIGVRLPWLVLRDVCYAGELGQCPSKMRSKV